MDAKDFNQFLKSDSEIFKDTHLMLGLHKMLNSGLSTGVIQKQSVFERTTGGKAPVEFIKEKKAKAAKV
jgi:hypothetical protein